MLSVLFFDMSMTVEIIMLYEHDVCLNLNT